MTVKHRFQEGLETEEDPSPHGGSGRRSGASAHRAPCLRAPPATWDLPRLLPHLSSARWPGWRLRARVPARTHLPILCPPGASLGTTAPGQCGQEAKPAPPPQACPHHSLSESASAPWVREDAGTPAGGGRLRGWGAWGDRGLGSPAAWLAQRGGSRLSARWLAPGAGACSVCARARVCASVRECAGGDAGETLLFPLLLLGRSLRPPRPRPTPPGTLGSVVPAPLLDRLPREGSGDLLTSTPQPGLAMVRA